MREGSVNASKLGATVQGSLAHTRVEAEITKGKCHDYDTFLGREEVWGR